MQSHERQFDNHQLRGSSGLVRFGYRLYKGKNSINLLQLIGSGFLAVMVCIHFAETYHLFPQMGWGLPHSAGHYIDLVSAWGGVTLLALSYLLRKLAHRRI